MNHGGPAVSPAGTFDAADVTFAESMIPHHQQAVRMAAMAGGRVADARVGALAGRIEAAQQPGITTMTGWLAAWGRPAPMPGTGMHAGPGHGSMPGMMSDADMAVPAQATGPAFDKHFLTLMISHHEGAVAMARQEVGQGRNPEAKAPAAKIITGQEAEIALMRTLLDEL